MKKHSCLSITVGILLLSFCAITCPQDFVPRFWKAKSGAFELRARLVEQTAQTVKLRATEDGRIVKTLIENLSDEDVEYLKQNQLPAEKKLIEKVRKALPNYQPLKERDVMEWEKATKHAAGSTVQVVVLKQPEVYEPADQDAGGATGRVELGPSKIPTAWLATVIGYSIAPTIFVPMEPFVLTRKWSRRFRMESKLSKMCRFA